MLGFTAFRSQIPRLFDSLINSVSNVSATLGKAWPCCGERSQVLRAEDERPSMAKETREALYLSEVKRVFLRAASPAGLLHSSLTLLPSRGG
jgi:hypothetical protein